MHEFPFVENSPGINCGQQAMNAVSIIKKISAQDIFSKKTDLPPGFHFIWETVFSVDSLTDMKRNGDAPKQTFFAPLSKTL